MGMASIANCNSHYQRLPSPEGEYLIPSRDLQRGLSKSSSAPPPISRKLKRRRRVQTWPGWWFGTWILFSHIKEGMSSSQLTFTPSFFRGVGIPPSSGGWRIKWTYLGKCNGSFNPLYNLYPHISEGLNEHSEVAGWGILRIHLGKLCCDRALFSPHCNDA